MKQLNGSITKALIISVMIILLLVTGAVFSHADEKADISTAVFYVA
jgi:hypothetical protein